MSEQYETDRDYTVLPKPTFLTDHLEDLGGVDAGSENKKSKNNNL